MTKKVTNYHLSQKLDHVVERVDDIHTCVFGNASPEKGLAFRVVQNEGFINGQRKLMWIIITASIGSMVAAIWTLLQMLVQIGIIAP